MKISFTGTRKGMTISQWASVATVMAVSLDTEGGNEWHNGDAIGADHQANQSMFNIKKMYPEFGIVTHGHPCNLPQQRAHDEYDIEHEIKPPLVRNRIMVDSSDMLIAAPFEYDEVIRGSGTWATIRYAKAHGVETWIIWPDGTKDHLPGAAKLPDIDD